PRPRARSTGTRAASRAGWRTLSIYSIPTWWCWEAACRASRTFTKCSRTGFARISSRRIPRSQSSARAGAMPAACAARRGCGRVRRSEIGNRKSEIRVSIVLANLLVFRLLTSDFQSLLLAFRRLVEHDLPEIALQAEISVVDVQLPADAVLEHPERDL